MTSLIKKSADCPPNYKNAFQWDAYRPLVDSIPACTARWGEGGVYPGVSARGVSAYGLREGRVSAYGLGEGAV